MVPFSGWEAGGSPVPRSWEPPPAPTRVLTDPAASPPSMSDGSGAGFGFQWWSYPLVWMPLHLASACVWQIHHRLYGFVIVTTSLVFMA